MENKELYDILHEYADDVKSEKESAFKKLNENSQEEIPQTRKKIHSQNALAINMPKYAFIIAMCMVVVVLCIVLPITLTNNTQNGIEPTFCGSGEIVYNFEGNTLADIEKYHIGAYYPIFETDSENMAVCSILSNRDASLHGVQIGYVIEEDEDITSIEMAIVPKTHVLQPYEDYFSLQNKLQWNEYEIKFDNQYDNDALINDMQIYFTDGKYDYFIAVESDERIEADELLNLLYK